jgi:hypothetical protein
MMGAVVAVGPAVRMLGWSLAGVEVRAAESVEEAAAALAHIDSDCSLLLLAPSVADATARVALPRDTLVTVLP